MSDVGYAWLLLPLLGVGALLVVVFVVLLRVLALLHEVLAEVRNVDSAVFQLTTQLIKQECCDPVPRSPLFRHRKMR